MHGQTKVDFVFRFLNKTVEEEREKEKKLFLGWLFDDLL
jgi:hypothetical protein